MLIKFLPESNEAINEFKSRFPEFKFMQATANNSHFGDFFKTVKAYDGTNLYQIIIECWNFGEEFTHAPSFVTFTVDTRLYFTEDEFVIYSLTFNNVPTIEQMKALEEKVHNFYLSNNFIPDPYMKD